MAAGPLSLHPALRSWYGAGLRHIYLDDEALAHMAETQEQRTAQAPRTSPATAPSTTRGTAPVAPQNANHVDAGTQYTKRVPPRPQANARPIEQKPQAPQAPPAPQFSPASQAPQGPQASTLSPEHWPNAWRERLASTAKGAPVLWTYWALGEDLSGAPNAPRRDILRRILGELNLPRGTHSFWPIALPSNSGTQQTDIPSESTPSIDMQLEDNAPLFLAGLNILAPRVCVIMGSKALRTILPHSTTGPFQQAQHGRFLFLVLPDMDMLLAESERVPRVVAYLRMALQSFMR